MNLLIVDDHPMTCAGLKSLLQACYPQSCIHTLHSTDGLLAAAPVADYVFLDMHLPNADFASVLDLMAAHLPRTILISASPEPALVQRARLRGVRGLLLKNADITQVLAGFQRIQAGELVFDDAGMGGAGMGGAGMGGAGMSGGWPEPVLTERQRRVLEALLSGQSNKQIARDLAISEHTVKDHVTAILSAFGVKNRLELVLKQQHQPVV